MDFFEKNLSVIASQQPLLTERLLAVKPSAQAIVQTSRSGLPGLLVGQNRLTSSVDPVEEGLALARSLEPGPVAALGFGLGYHLEPLAQAGRQVLVWEPDISLLRLALGVRDMSAWLHYCKIILEINELPDIRSWRPFIPRAMERLYHSQASVLKRLCQLQPDNRSPRPAEPKVLIIPPLLGGSLDPSYWCAQAMHDLGCQVRVVPMEKMAPLYRHFSSIRRPRAAQAQSAMIRFLGELALLEAEEFAPHLLLALAQAPLSRDTVEKIKKLDVKTAFWFMEDFRQMSYYAEIAAHYDFFFYIQGKEIEERLEHLGANHHFLPVAAHPPCHRPLALSPARREELGATIGFMGAGYPNRIRILGRLLQAGLPLTIWGSDWPANSILSRALREDRYISSQEIVEFYNACEIVLNLHSSPRASAPVGSADFINPRTFEAPACGAFQLVDNVPGLEKFFVPEEELATFNNEEELMEKARFYLERPTLRAAMAAKARQKVLSQHTYYHRMERLLDICLGPGDQVWQADSYDPINWLPFMAVNHQGG
jgi:spore maturation protein CgeB